MPEVNTTDEYGFEVENEELLDELEVIDAEVHTTENIDDIVELLDDPELRRLEESGYVLEASANGAFGTIPWNFYNHKSGEERGGLPLLTSPLKSIEDIESQMNDIKADKVIVNSLHAIQASNIPNTEKQVAYLRAANRYMMENLAVDNDKYFTAIGVDPNHPEESAEEIRKYMDNDNVAYIISSANTEKPMGHKRHKPLFEAVEESGLPFVMHGMSADIKGFPGGGLDMDTHFEHRALTQVLGHVRNATSLVAQGIPEKYDIDFVFIEHCISWVPMLMNRLDREFEIKGHEAEIDRKPSEYLREFYYGTQVMEKAHNPDYIGKMLEMMELEDQIIYTSDYPHPDGDHPGTIIDHEGLSREQKKKILQDNPRRLFDLD